MRKSAFLAIGLTALVAAPVGLTEAADAPNKRQKPVRAKAFRSCSGLTRYARRHALKTVEPRRLVSPGPVGAPVPMPVGAPERGGPPAPVATSPTLDHSPTNIQETGVDEADFVKTDGSRIFTVTAGKLHAVDVTGRVPRLAGSLPLGEGADHQMLLRGGRLLVVSSAYPDVTPLPVRGASIVPLTTKTTLAEVDVRDPSAMRVVRTLEVDGTYVSSRLHGGTARVVIASQPRALVPPPEPRTLEPSLPTPGAEASKAARQRRRASRPSQWLPSYVLRNSRTGRSVTRRLVRCRAVRRATAFSGLDTLTVLTIDLDKGLPPVDSDGLMTDAQIVYASSKSLYVATQQWLRPGFPERQGQGASTAIHKFAIADADSTVYRASGEVSGFLLNQFSLSEHRGLLRAATTEQPIWLETGPARQSESFVTVLEERSGRLTQVGRVGGLGHGERIYSVRFIDDVGFVVTFRQTDPLYTVDLSAPDRPIVRGELEILGYSAYLHPVGKDLLLGVGQDATPEGGTLGTQLSLFDVADLSRPVRLHRRTIAPGSSSEVEYDHHAFLHWPPAGLAVLPLQVYGVGRGAQEFNGAVGFRIGRESGIQEAGRISHPVPYLPVRRALVVGSRLFTVSERGIEASSLETLAGLAWVPFE